MQESNEVERLLKQTLGVKMEAREIQTLPLGHFMVAVRDTVNKVYVWPWKVPADIAIDVAKGIRDPEYVRGLIRSADRLPLQSESSARPEEQEFNAYVKGIENRLEALSRRVDIIEHKSELVEKCESVKETLTITQPIDKLSLEHQAIEVDVHHVGDKTVEASTRNAEGQMLYCMVKDLPTEGFTTKELKSKLIERGWSVTDKTISAKLSVMTSQAKLVKTNTGYRLPKKVRFKVEDPKGAVLLPAEE
jgi:hypothetical protein